MKLTPLTRPLRLVPVALVGALASGLVPLPPLVGGSPGLWVAPAQAQLIWRDENGRKVISDSPPPPGVKAADILRQPSAPALVGSPAPGSGGEPGAAGAKPASPPAAAPKSLADQELEFRKRVQEREKAEARQAADEARAAQRAQECERARGYLRALEDGTPVVQTTPDGGRNYLDDEQRNAEVQRARDAVARNCTGS